MEEAGGQREDRSSHLWDNHGLIRKCQRGVFQTECAAEPEHRMFAVETFKYCISTDNRDTTQKAKTDGRRNIFTVYKM